MNRFSLGLLVALTSIASIARADDFDLKIDPKLLAEPAERLPFMMSEQPAQGGHPTGLPFLGDQARAAGYDIPLPFGAGAIYNYLQRDIEVSDLRIGINGGAETSVNQFVDLGSRSHVNVGLGRFDVFLFPFLNVYTLLGYLHNSSTTNGIVTVPNPGPGPGTTSFPFVANTSIDGFVGGFGVTLAGGYKSFFAALDSNWTASDLGFDDKFHAFTSALRLGINEKVHGMPFRVWTGAAYWDTASTAASTVQVPGVGTVSFEADQGPTRNFNMVVGGQLTLPHNIDLFMEYGNDFESMQYFAGGLTFRF